MLSHLSIFLIKTAWRRMSYRMWTHKVEDNNDDQVEAGRCDGGDQLSVAAEQF